MQDDHGYSPRRKDFDPMAMANLFPQPTEDYPPHQSPYAPPPVPAYAPPPAPLAPRPIGDNLPTVKVPTTVQPVYVPYPQAEKDSGGGMAILSVLLGIFSILVSVIPVCGIVALFPAILGIVCGGAGMKSRKRRGLAMAGMILSMLAIAIAFAIVV